MWLSSLFRICRFWDVRIAYFSGFSSASVRMCGVEWASDFRSLSRLLEPQREFLIVHFLKVVFSLFFLQPFPGHRARDYGGLLELLSSGHTHLASLNYNNVDYTMMLIG